MKNTSRKALQFLFCGALQALSTPSLFAGEFNVSEYHPVPGRKVVCTMTLNSSNEKRAFIEHSREINEAVDYVELTPPGSSPSRNEWLDQSCGLLQKNQIRCDEFILSSHFGPRLYGSARKEIDLDYLEKMSCEETCSNLFAHLKKSYLFACNTLSGTADDHRRAENQEGMNSSDRASSQQNYVVIQMSHDASRSWAEEASESRYGKYGAGGSFGERFLRVFSNREPKNEVYGFTTVDDRGSNIAPLISRALRQNIPLEIALRGKHLIKKSGSLTEESRHIKAVSCQLSKYDYDPDAVMNNIVGYYSTAKDFTHEKLFPMLIQFIMNHYTTNHTIHDDDVIRPDITRNAWATSLSKNDDLKAFVLAGIHEKAFPSSTLMSWSTFAHKLGWISDEERRMNLGKALFGLLRPPYNSESKDDVLHFAKIFPDSASSLRVGKMMPESVRTSSQAKSLVEEIRRLYPEEIDSKIVEWANLY